MREDFQAVECHAGKLMERSFSETLLAKEKYIASPEKVHVTCEWKRKTTSDNAGKRC